MPAPTTTSPSRSPSRSSSPASGRSGRRAPATATSALAAGDLGLDELRHAAQVGDRSVDLSAREFALLGYLIRHAGQVLTRQQILDAVWGAEPDVYSNVVDLYIHYLRRKLGELGRAGSVANRARGRLHAPGGRLSVASPTDRLIASTRRRSFATTLALLFLLVVGIGAATAFVGLQALDADVDQALRSSVAAAVTGLDGEIPRASDGETDEGLPAAADTFLLVLDPGGSVVSNPSRIRLVGLPATAALRPTGEDLRTVNADGLSVRLLTMPVTHDGALAGYVQGGFVLSLHDRQSASLVASVAAVALIGLVAAALVTLVVTGRSLARSAGRSRPRDGSSPTRRTNCGPRPR